MPYSSIVSANYNDRGRVAGNPWLLRGVSELPQDAVPAQAIVASGVAFCPSSDYEYGFGCTIVAFCETAETTTEPRTDGVRLTFDYDGFYGPSGRRVDRVEQLILNPDGSMYATLPKRPRWTGMGLFDRLLSRPREQQPAYA